MKIPDPSSERPLLSIDQALLNATLPDYLIPIADPAPKHTHRIYHGLFNLYTAPMRRGFGRGFSDPSHACNKYGSLRLQSFAAHPSAYTTVRDTRY